MNEEIKDTNKKDVKFTSEELGGLLDWLIHVFDDKDEEKAEENKE